MNKLLDEGYGFLFEPELLDEIKQVGTYKEVEKGQTLMQVGSSISHIPLLLEGALKIMREDDDGDELLLYFLERGDTCAMTLTCCLDNSKSQIKAVAVTDTKLILIPVEKMGIWTQAYKSWMNFVFESYNTRLNEMLDSIDSLAFLDMHDRLHKYLIDKVKITGNTIIENTHQEIAFDLNTSRVVVSRILKKLEKENQIKLHRNRLELLHF